MNLPTDWHEWVFWYLVISLFTAGASWLSDPDYTLWGRLKLGLLWFPFVVILIAGGFWNAFLRLIGKE